LRSSVRATSAVVLAAAATAAGHDVTVTAAHHEHAVQVAERVGASAAASPAEAAQGADVVVLAVPAAAAAEVLGQLGDTGAVVVDATNPLNDTYSDLTTSGTRARPSSWLRPPSRSC
jgi:predicted dinucleotide-binding enzyme